MWKTSLNWNSDQMWPFPSPGYPMLLTWLHPRHISCSLVLMTHSLHRWWFCPSALTGINSIFISTHFKVAVAPPTSMATDKTQRHAKQHSYQTPNRVWVIRRTQTTVLNHHVMKNYFLYLSLTSGIFSCFCHKKQVTVTHFFHFH